MTALGQGQKARRLVNELRRRIPSLTSSIGSVDLTYSDLLKYDARATELGALADQASDRIAWIRELLERLESWAASAIKSNEVLDYRGIRASISRAEEEFSKSFCRTVPLFKLLTSSNRKALRVLDEYEARSDDWVPLSLASAPAEQQIRILSPEDQVKVAHLHESWICIVNAGYFELDKVLRFLKGLHNADLRSNSSYSLFTKALKLHGMEFERVDSHKCHVRVRPSVVHKLVAVVALSASEENVSTFPAGYVSEIRKAVLRSGDAQFKKLCQKRLTELSLKLFPSKVDAVLAELNTAFGEERKPRKMTKKRTFDPTEFESKQTGSMRTRSRAAAKKQRVRLNGVTFQQLERLKLEGEELLRFSKKNASLIDALSNLELAISKASALKTDLEYCIARGEIVKTDLSDPEVLWLYKLDLEDSIASISQRVAGTHPGLLRNFLPDIKRILFRLRLEHFISECVLRIQTLSFEEASRIVSLGMRTGVLAWVDEAVADAKTKLKQEFRSLDQLEQFVNQFSFFDSKIRLRIDTSACSEFLTASALLKQAKAVEQSSIDFLTHLGLLHSLSDVFEAASSMDRVSRQSLSELVASLNAVTQEVEMEGEWIHTLLALDWIVQATAAMDAKNMNRLIELHRKAVIVEEFSQNASSVEIKQLLDSVSKIVEKVSSLIDGLRKGAFGNLALLDQRHVCVPEVEQVRMDLEDVSACMHRMQSETVLEITTIQQTSIRLENFFTRYSLEPSPAVQDRMAQLATLLEANRALETGMSVRENLAILSRVKSIEIERARKALEKTDALASEISAIISKRSDLPGVPLLRLLETLEAKHSLLKRVAKLRVAIDENVLENFLTSIHSTATHLLMRWAERGRSLIGSTPRWLHLYMLRATGGWLKVKELDWLGKQLDLSNDIIKSAKRSVSDFSKNRFLAPLFHFALFEPLEKIRVNLQQKESVVLKLVFEPSLRRLESIAVLSADKHKLIDRQFPRPNATASRALLVEPDNSESVSDEFEKRKIPATLDECMQQILLVGRSMLADLRRSSSLASGFPPESGKKSITTTTNQSGGSSSSFTKFLSSSFLSLEVKTNTEGEDGSEWINKIDQLLAHRGEGATLTRYADLLSLPNEESPEPVAPPVLLKPSTPTALPGFQAPPSAPVQTEKKLPAVTIAEAAETGFWTGELIGPKHAYRMSVSLLPLFRSPQTNSSDFSAMKKSLAGHSSWTFEGSLSVAKFGEHYSKLMHPAHRAKREPYNFLLACTSEKHEVLLEHIGVNTAHAFAIIVAPYKVKLWIVNVDGRTPYLPLPLSEGPVFAFIEMPIAVFHPCACALENLFTADEIDHAVDRIRLQTAESADTLVERLPQHTVVIQSEPIPVYSSPPPREPEPKRTKTIDEYERPPPSMPSAYFSRPMVKASAPTVPGFVIGAPSTGPALDQLPNVQKGLCRFFNTVQGCQTGNRCRYVHKCSICGSDAHAAIFHDGSGPPDIPRQSFYQPFQGPFRP